MFSCHLPEHMMPSPVKPVLHLHVKLPSVLEHSASMWQLSTLALHSSISKAKSLENNFEKYANHTK